MCIVICVVILKNLKTKTLTINYNIGHKLVRLSGQGLGPVEFPKMVGALPKIEYKNIKTMFRQYILC